MDIELYTNAGEFVHRATIPPFLKGHHPEVILWGDRVFSLDFIEKSGICRYRECFFYPLIDS